MKNILSQIKRGDSTLPPRILLAGQEGIGKTTFAAQFPSPLFICSEDGLTGFEHIPRLCPASLDQLYQALDELATNIGDFKTIVVDTADWLERLIYASICERDGKSNIEDYGFGKGYAVAESELIRVLQKLDTLRVVQRVQIVIVSHVQIRAFQDPRGQSWDRFEMKGNKKITGILREWPDACLFATYEVHKVKRDGIEKAIGGDRVIHTQWSPAWDAKNRLNLPETLPLDHQEFAKAVAHNSVPALRERVKAAFTAVSETLVPEERTRWEKWLANLPVRPADQLNSALAALGKLANATATPATATT